MKNNPVIENICNNLGVDYSCLKPSNKYVVATRGVVTHDRYPAIQSSEDSYTFTCFSPNSRSNNSLYLAKDDVKFLYSENKSTEKRKFLKIQRSIVPGYDVYVDTVSYSFKKLGESLLPVKCNKIHITSCDLNVKEIVIDFGYLLTCSDSELEDITEVSKKISKEFIENSVKFGHARLNRIGAIVTTVYFYSIFIESIGSDEIRSVTNFNLFFNVMLGMYFNKGDKNQIEQNIFNTLKSCTDSSNFVSPYVTHYSRSDVLRSMKSMFKGNFKWFYSNYQEEVDLSVVPFYAKG